MAAATLASTRYIQGIAKVFNFTAAANTNTFTFKDPVKAWNVTNLTDGTTADASYVASTGVFTFNIPSGTPDLQLTIYQ